MLRTKGGWKWSGGGKPLLSGGPAVIPQANVPSWVIGPRLHRGQKCKCKTHKEGAADVRTAYRTAGFMIVFSESGVVGALAELVTAETLSQRYCFLAEVASETTELTTVVHDDACHLCVFANNHQDDNNPLTARLACNMRYVVDRPHSRNHVDPQCKAHCFPTVPANAQALGTFPTPIAESVNSQLSPLARTIHHMQKFLCSFVASECVDVHNIVRGQERERRKVRCERKRARETSD